MYTTSMENKSSKGHLKEKYKTRNIKKKKKKKKKEKEFKKERKKEGKIMFITGKNVKRENTNMENKSSKEQPKEKYLRKNFLKHVNGKK